MPHSPDLRTFVTALGIVFCMGCHANQPNPPVSESTLKALCSLNPDDNLSKMRLLGPNGWGKEALIQKITFQSGPWTLSFRENATLFRIYPAIKEQEVLVPTLRAYACICVNVEGDWTEDEFRDALTKGSGRDAKIIEYDISFANGKSRVFLKDAASPKEIDWTR